MEKIILVVGYFPKEKVYCTKIVKNDARAEYWKNRWVSDGGKVVVGKTFYADGEREQTYHLLKQNLIKEIKNDRR